MSLDPEAEARLIERMRRRDPAAFNQFVRAYEARVFGLVYRMLGDKTESEDVSQEVFITVYRSIGNFREDSALGTWLFRVAVNHCKNRLKYMERRQNRAHDALEDLSERAVSDGGTMGHRPARPDEAADGTDMERAVRVALRSLDEEYRTLVVLRDLEGLSYEDIAQITGLMEGTVKSRLHRARAALREAVERGLGWKIPV